MSAPPGIAPPGIALAIDTASNDVSLALLDLSGDGERVLFELAWHGDRTLSERLLAGIDTLLDEAGVERERIAFHSCRKNFVRALELAKVDRDRAAQIVGHERGFTFRVYNPEGIDVAGLREVVEAVNYKGLTLR